MIKVIIIALVAILTNATFAQGLRRGAVSQAQTIANELKGLGSEPDENFDVLLEKALKDDPRALYALGLDCIRKGVGRDRRNDSGCQAFDYILKSAELGYFKPQFAIALIMHSRFTSEFNLDQVLGSYDVRLIYLSHDLLRNVDVEKDADRIRAYYKNAVASGYGCVTNLMAMLERDIVKEKEKNRKNEERRIAAEEAKRKIAEANLKHAGKSLPFVPFVEIGKLDYADAVKRAKDGDAEAYYWLAYYFAKGEIIDCDASSAWKFLTRAAEGNKPEANYIAGQMLEEYALQDEEGNYNRDREITRLYSNYNFRWGRLPQMSGDKCFTNAVATECVISYYKKAVEGGLVYATNDIARLQKKIDACRGRINQKMEEQRKRGLNAQSALDLLKVEKDPVTGEVKSTDEAAEEKRLAEADREREKWQSWPRGIRYNDEELIAAAKNFENDTMCVAPDTTKSEWIKGCGKSCVIYSDQDYYIEYDANGILVAVSSDRSKFEILRRIDEKRSEMIKILQEKWAAERGMTYEDAKAGYEKWSSQNSMLGRRPLLGGSRLTGGSLRSRRGLRAQQPQPTVSRQLTEQERAEREAQRRQLQQIQEELKRVREAQGR